MCGIIGYTGTKQAAPVLLGGLKRLEYRGYDSSGIATVKDGKILTAKAKGKIAILDEKISGGTKLGGTVGIGHTRWATHGVPNEANAHPHRSADGRFAVVHNGIIENFFDIKSELTALGYAFASDTDTETVAMLLQHLYRGDGDVLSTICALQKRLCGSYAIGIVCADTPDVLYAVRKDNPLVVGLGNGENFIASDVTAALEHTHDFVLLGDGETARITPDHAEFFDADGKPVKKQTTHIDWDIGSAEKSGYAHFMLKEIFDQPKALTDTLRPRIHGDKIVLDDIDFDSKYLDSLSAVDIVGCGSAYHAGIVGKHFIEKHCKIRVNCSLASEYIYSDPITGGDVLTVIISQSGETADTLAALRLAKSRGSRTIAVVNVVESAIAREADGVLYTHAGPEIAVATTKGYTTQVAALYLIGLKIAERKHTVSDAKYKSLIRELLALSDKVRSQLSDENIAAVKKYADRFSSHKCVFFIGRGTDYAASLEGALKLKEISYIHAEAYAAGELKHGTISLIENGTVTLALVTQSALYPKMENNIKAVKSREGTILAVSSPDNVKIAVHTDGLLTIPECDDDVSPVLTAVVLQLFAYYIALGRGCDIDQPRNLAKSVTVE